MVELMGLLTKGFLMNRKEFLEAACAWGVCSCAVFSQSAQAEEQADATQAELGNLKWKLDFVTQRFAKLVALMNETLDESTLAGLFESMGRECAKGFKQEFEPFKGDPEGFLKSIQQKWVQSARWDESTGTVRVVDKAKHCTCAFVNEKIMSSQFCHCSVGWQKEAYETVLGRPVDVEIEESILKGHKRCVFCIKLQDEKA